MKRWKRTMILAVMMFICLLAGSINGQAKNTDPVCEADQKVYWDDKTSYPKGNIFIGNMQSDSIIYDVSTDNKKFFGSTSSIFKNLVEVEGIENLKNKEVVKVNITIIKNKGETYKLKSNLIFIKKKSMLFSPLKSLKIGGKECINSIKRDSYGTGYQFTLNSNASKISVSLKGKKGYIINKIYREYFKNGWKKSVDQVIKNNSTIDRNYTLGILIDYSDAKLPKYFSSKYFNKGYGLSYAEAKREVLGKIMFYSFTNATPKWN